MEQLRIITNNNWRQIRYRYEVPPQVLADEFDYQDEDDTSDGYIYYKGQWYHLDMFMNISQADPHCPFPSSQWQGYHADTFFSGILLQVSDDGEEYRIARYMS